MNRKEKAVKWVKSSKEWEVANLVNEYLDEVLPEGSDYLFPINCLFPMSRMDVIEPNSELALRKMLYGGRYGFEQDMFNPTDEWFMYNGYGNLVSIPYIVKYILEEHLDGMLDQGYFDNLFESEER